MLKFLFQKVEKISIPGAFWAITRLYIDVVKRFCLEGVVVLVTVFV